MPQHPLGLTAGGAVTAGVVILLRIGGFVAFSILVANAGAVHSSVDGTPAATVLLVGEAAASSASCRSSQRWAVGNADNCAHLSGFAMKRSGNRTRTDFPNNPHSNPGAARPVEQSSPFLARAMDRETRQVPLGHGLTSASLASWARPILFTL